MSYIATIGFFDGVHRGHQYLIAQLQQLAQESGLSSAIITFSEHPRQVLEGHSPALLLTREEREQRLKESGVRQVFEFNFSLVKDMSAEAFMRLLHEQCGVERLLMGYDHHFGSDRLTDIKDYRQAGERAGVAITVAEEKQRDGEAEEHISSTTIRRALTNGQIETANGMLGYKYSLSGEVVHGRHVGSQMGFPTANMQTAPDKLIPHSGVYAVSIDCPAMAIHGTKALLNIGTNPTFSEDLPLSVELHIPHYKEDLYGQTITAELLCLLRDEQHFATVAELQQQIQKDLDSLDKV
ncbi:MAG: riboflavin biosynthesis protein RibF [Paludibacteraceae bacterium]|nr:riboflavin biosynthesis protein RibF [Paludibacteraceae bacterium]